MDWLIDIPDDGRKPSIAAIFRSPQGRSVANVSKMKKKMLFLSTWWMFSENFMIFISPDVIVLKWVSDVRLTAFFRTADSEVHVIHISRVIMTSALKLSSSLTQITYNLHVTINFIRQLMKRKHKKVRAPIKFTFGWRRQSSSVYDDTDIQLVPWLK